jgi:hypothetical protein
MCHSPSVAGESMGGNSVKDPKYAQRSVRVVVSLRSATTTVLLADREGDAQLEQHLRRDGFEVVAAAERRPDIVIAGDDAPDLFDNAD